MSAIRIRIALITVVCGLVFYTSFRHIVAVAMAYGNTRDVAIAYPFAIDFVILISALTLIARKGVTKAARNWARFGRLFGFSATIFCNLVTSHFANTVAAIVAVIPAIALIVTVELLIHGAKGTAAARLR